jgi:hypothetical protein
MDRHGHDLNRESPSLAGAGRRLRGRRKATLEPTFVVQGFRILNFGRQLAQEVKVDGRSASVRRRVVPAAKQQLAIR